MLSLVGATTSIIFIATNDTCGSSRQSYLTTVKNGERGILDPTTTAAAAAAAITTISITTTTTNDNNKGYLEHRCIAVLTLNAYNFFKRTYIDNLCMMTGDEC